MRDANKQQHDTMMLHSSSTHIVKACNVFVFSKKLCRALLLKVITLGFGGLAHGLLVGVGVEVHVDVYDDPTTVSCDNLVYTAARYAMQRSLCRDGVVSRAVLSARKNISSFFPQQTMHGHAQSFLDHPDPTIHCLIIQKIHGTACGLRIEIAPTSKHQ